MEQFAERARVAAAADPGRRTAPLSLEEEDQPAAPSRGGFATPVTARPGVAGAPHAPVCWNLVQGPLHSRSRDEANRCMFINCSMWPP